MWFKQAQIFQLTDSMRFSPEDVAEKLAIFTFEPCLPSLFSTQGWVPPAEGEEGAPLVRHINGYIAICLQIEEKILPATVIRQGVEEKVKEITQAQNRKVYGKEKLALKDEVIFSLLPRAFSKFTKIHAYLDTKNHWLILSTTNAKKTEQFMSAFKKAMTEDVHAFELKKLSPTLTHWLKHKDYPMSFAVEKTCVFQDPQQQNRVVRCQNQDLFAQSIQTLIKEGCEVKKLALSWQDRIDFTLLDNFSLQTIKYKEELLAQAKDMEAETSQQHFDVDFLIMTGTLSGLVKDLLSLFMEEESKSNKVVEETVSKIF